MNLVKTHFTPQPLSVTIAHLRQGMKSSGVEVDLLTDDELVEAIIGSMDEEAQQYARVSVIIACVKKRAEGDTR